VTAWLYWPAPLGDDAFKRGSCLRGVGIDTGGYGIGGAQPRE
jgi:hypothetical protein